MGLTVTSKMLGMATMLMLITDARCSTSATPCTTTMASWSAWTSTASCAEKELSLTSRP